MVGNKVFRVIGIETSVLLTGSGAAAASLSRGGVFSTDPVSVSSTADEVSDPNKFFNFPGCSHIERF